MACNARIRAEFEQGEIFLSNVEIEALIQSMTLREKLAQMTQLSAQFLMRSHTGTLTGPERALNLLPQDLRSLGSVLYWHGAEDARALQERHLREDPHRIPLLFAADIIHGYDTIYPIPLAMACSFDPPLMKDACAMAAREGTAAGIHLTFSPMADLSRDARWGRVMESGGEDPVLNAAFAAAAVEGYGGPAGPGPHTIAACVKHFAGYGGAQAGRDYNTVELSRGTLLDQYMPGYRAALDAGAAMVMASFNTIDRVPATANRWLLRDLLREQWGFDGVIITDFNAIEELVAHGVAEDSAQAAELALRAGVDIEMMSTTYLHYGEALVASGRVEMAAIDDAVRRILRLKEKLGLFEDPYRGLAAPRPLPVAPRRACAYKSAVRSMVLLKNDGVLPLRKEAALGLAGPFADTKQVFGEWAAADNSTAVTVLDGLRVAGMAHVTVAAAGALERAEGRIAEIPDQRAECAALADCDVILAAVGEHQNETGEAASRTSLRLSPNQEALIAALSALGKPVVAVVFSGRPLELSPVLEQCAAVVQAWFPGHEAGSALADLLLGREDFTARLAMSFPRSVGQMPLYYGQAATGRPFDEADPQKYVSRYLDCSNRPLFPFGYGLSYAAFAYDGLSVTPAGGGVDVTVTVRNTSDRAGTETVQVYIHDVAASVARPVRELKAFAKVHLAPGQVQQVRLHLPHEAFCFIGQELVPVFEPGLFEIYAGPNAAEGLRATIRLDA